MKALKTIAFASLAAALLLTAACAGTTRVGDVLADTSKYDGKQITITGTVGDTFWGVVVDKGAYQVGDGSGTIWVVTSQPPPQQGLTVTTTGTVQPAFSLGGRSFGTVLIESKRG